MDHHAHFDDTKENNEVTEASDNSVNISVNELLQHLNLRY